MKYAPTIRGMVVGVCLFAIALAVVSIAGCSSASRDISKAATQAAAASRSTDAHLDAIGVAATEAATMLPEESPVSPLLDTIQVHATAAKADQATIQASTSAVHTALPGVKDVTPWWASLLARIAGALILLGLIFLAYTSGIFPIIRAFFAGLGWFIPRPVAIRAKFDAENIEAGKASPDRLQVVAAQRGADPVYDKAFKREQTKLRTLKGGK